ncbi:MAG: hypothetical protein JO033_22060 [Acidobacteriaceae bacterium]|nr:hypothetical protein [Acidobacteriaceae bacterium]MBV9497756.1 hypothetical protein [Acidobacteriaceae bacterium]
MAGTLLSRRITLRTLVGMFAISAGPTLRGQEKASQGSQSDSEEQNIDTYANLLREDVRKQKVAITSQLMELSPEQAATFWPIYNDYAKELSALGDLRVRGIKEYAANYSSLSDEKATELANMRFNYEEKLLALKKKYFEKFSKALTPKLAARFFQIENQLLDIIDLQVASSLPIVPAAQR